MTTLAEALAPKSDQLNADDLIPGPRTIKITDARIVKGDRQTRITLSFEGDNGKPFKPCKTMGRAMVMVWGVTDEKQMIGKSITVYRDPSVKFGDQGEVGGIRISHMSHIDRPASVKLTVSQGKKGAFVFQPLTAEVKQIKPDRAAEGVKALLVRIVEGEDIDEDATVTTQRKWLEANRPELFAQIEEALKARYRPAAADDADDPFAGGPADEQRGESHTVDADYIIEHINKKARVIDVNALVDSHMDTIMAMAEEDRDRVSNAQFARVDAIKAEAE